MFKKKNCFSFVVVVLLLLLCPNGVSGINCGAGEGFTRFRTSGNCTEHVTTENRCKELVAAVISQTATVEVVSIKVLPRGCIRHYNEHCHGCCSECCRRLGVYNKTHLGPDIMRKLFGGICRRLVALKKQSRSVDVNINRRNLHEYEDIEYF